MFDLPGTQVETILDRVSALAVPNSWLCLDIINSAMLNSPLTGK